MRFLKNSLGYPSASLVTLWFEQGGVWLHAHRQSGMPDHPEAERMEHALHVLQKEDPVLSKALRIRYPEPGATKQQARLLRNGLI